MDTWQTPAGGANRWLIGLIVWTRPGWRVDHLNVLGLLGVLGAIAVTAAGAHWRKNALLAAMRAFRGVHGLPPLARASPA